MDGKEETPDVVIKHIHSEREPDYLREISITSPLYSITLTSSFPEEDMEFLIEKSLFVLKKLKEE